jgi:hypothetical protein
MISPSAFYFFRKIDDSLVYANEDGATKAKSERKPEDFKFYDFNPDNVEPLEEARYTLTGNSLHSY